MGRLTHFPPPFSLPPFGACTVLCACLPLLVHPPPSTNIMCVSLLHQAAALTQVANPLIPSHHPADIAFTLTFVSQSIVLSHHQDNIRPLSLLFLHLQLSHPEICLFHDLPPLALSMPSVGLLKICIQCSLIVLLLGRGSRITRFYKQCDPGVSQCHVPQHLLPTTKREKKSTYHILNALFFVLCIGPFFPFDHGPSVFSFHRQRLALLRHPD
ncbi:MAG: hypothetical protein J3Q66DRAFT_141305 [Benniella sp.]|nr:MAG: hypothetical protein J3Q66DRAFT_141305 [Benniella sp.]